MAVGSQLKNKINYFSTQSTTLTRHSEVMSITNSNSKPSQRFTKVVKQLHQSYVNTNK